MVLVLQLVVGRCTSTLHEVLSHAGACASICNCMCLCVSFVVVGVLRKLVRDVLSLFLHVVTKNKLLQFTNL